MENAEREEMIDAYASGSDRVAQSLHDFPAGQLTARLLPDKWTACEIVQHLADSEMASALRLRKLLAEDHPVIFGYDQDAYATRLNYNEREMEPALDTFRGARATTTQLLRRMTEDDWERTGWHTEHGLYRIEMWLRIYARHAHGHAEQIDRLREAITVPAADAAAS